ncbi:MAG: DMT family transporter [Bauldia sp.]
MATPFRENLRGIVAMVLCSAFFLFNDAFLKLASVEMPIGQLLFIRGLISALIIGTIVIWNGQFRSIRELWHWGIGLRCMAEIIAGFLFLYALLHTPIANMNAILQVIPLMITAAGAIFLGERVGWRRWTAIAIGFIGVLIIVRPGLAGFDAYSAIALFSMLFITLRDMTTRMVPRALPAMLIGLATSIAVGGSGAVYGLAESWTTPAWSHVALLIGSAVFLVGGYYANVIAMRHGDISVTAPFRYSVVVWAIVVGFLIWNEVPDLPMLVGTAVIIVTGIYTFQRERRLARMARLKG